MPGELRQAELIVDLDALRLAPTGPPVSACWVTTPASGSSEALAYPHRDHRCARYAASPTPVTAC